MITQEQFSALLPTLTDAELDAVEVALSSLRRAMESRGLFGWLARHYCWATFAGILWRQRAR